MAAIQEKSVIFSEPISDLLRIFEISLRRTSFSMLIAGIVTIFRNNYYLEILAQFERPDLVRCLGRCIATKGSFCSLDTSGSFVGCFLIQFIRMSQNVRQKYNKWKPDEVAILTDGLKRGLKGDSIQVLLAEGGFNRPLWAINQKLQSVVWLVFLSRVSQTSD